MENTNIVPSKKITELAPADILELDAAIEEITAVYEDANANLTELSKHLEIMQNAGSKYQKLTGEVSEKLRNITAKNILGRVSE